MSSSQEVTPLLLEWANGNNAAGGELITLVYGELRRLADHYLRGEGPEHTLQPTALVHEAYLRLVDQDLPQWQSRSHFFGVAAHMMRQILVDHARSHQTEKRGGRQPKAPIEDFTNFSRERSAYLLVLDDALAALAKIDSRKCQIVELRFFGGFTAEETAQALGISEVTVRRELRLAKAWLCHEMKKIKR